MVLLFCVFKKLNVMSSIIKTPLNFELIASRYPDAYGEILLRVARKDTYVLRFINREFNLREKTQFIAGNVQDHYAFNGYAALVEWSLAHITPTKSLYLSAIYSGNLELVKLVHGYTGDVLCVAHIAIGMCHVGVLKWLLENGHDDIIKSRYMNYVGRVLIVWCHKYNLPICGTEYWKQNTDYFETLNVMITHNCISAHNVADIAKRGYLDAIKLIYEKTTSYNEFYPKTLENFAYSGNFDVVKWMKSRGANLTSDTQLVVEMLN